MKEIRYIIGVIGVVLALASCSKQDEESEADTYTFNLILEEPEESTTSRARITAARYILEVYETDLNSTPVRQQNSTGRFNVVLNSESTYVCLFWADGGETEYNAETLKAVSQTAETRAGTVAYYAVKSITSKDFDKSVRMGRAVAELNFVDKTGLLATDNTLAVSYPFTSNTFNVANGTVSYTAGEVVRTFTGIGDVAADTLMATDYLLAPAVKSTISKLKFNFNSLAQKTITQTPIQANFRTKITGEFDGETGTSYRNAANAEGLFYAISGDGKHGKEDLFAVVE